MHLPPNLPRLALIFGAATVAGTINSVAGGGSFLSFPALIFYGLPPINANATNTVAVWPGQIFSAAAYREDIASARARLPWLMIVSAIGAVLGAVILLKTPQATFMKLIPWLLLGATLLFTFNKAIAARLPKASSGHGHNTPAALLVQFVISV